VDASESYVLEDIGRRLRELRAARGWTQDALSDRTGIRQERGWTQVDLATVSSLPPNYIARLERASSARRYWSPSRSPELWGSMGIR
jgi:transcriptional regulator with XRE-family HTH domain